MPRRFLTTLVAVVLVTAACGRDDGSQADSAPTSTAVTSTTSDAQPSTTSASDTSAPSTTTTTTTPPTTTTTAPPSTTPPSTTPPTSEPPTPPVLGRGDSGPAVAAVQRRLDELHYWVGPIDGIYGTLTEQAVYAFQKVNGIAVDGRVGPQLRGALESPASYPPQSSAGDILEVDKGRQVLVHVVDGTVQEIWNTSTGTENPYTHDGVEYLADTPPGRHTIDWQVDGIRQGSLGELYRPKYFHEDGIAVHGYGSVPPVPASHGCVRVTIPAMDFIWATGVAPRGSVVLVHGTTPGVSGSGTGPNVG